MVGIDAAQVVDMQGYARMVDETAEELDGQVDVEAAHARTRERHVELQAGAAGEVDHHARQAFVQRHVAVAVAGNALLVANGPGDSLAKRDADVFHRMVVVDMRVAGGFDLQVEHTMPGDLVKHVVEERHARRQFLAAGAVEIQGNADLRFRSIAGDLCNTHGVNPAATLRMPQGTARFLRAC
ncbi:hypothetical protein D3C81_1607510 [compost metagenome]